jgi:hypothetical protein
MQPPYRRGNTLAKSGRPGRRLTMNREELRRLVLGGGLVLLGLILFFRRFSIAEFFGIDITLFSEAPKVRAIGIVGAFVTVVGLAVVCATMWPKRPRENKRV